MMNRFCLACDSLDFNSICTEKAFPGKIDCTQCHKEMQLHLILDNKLSINNVRHNHYLYTYLLLLKDIQFYLKAMLIALYQQLLLWWKKLMTRRGIRKNRKKNRR